MTLTEALDLFATSLAGTTSKMTQVWYLYKLHSLPTFLDDMSIEQITIQDLRAWRAALIQKDSRWATHPGRPEEQGGLSPYTIHGHIRACRRFFRWLNDEGYIPYNPAERLKPPRLPDCEPKHVTEKDLNALIETARKKGARDYSIVIFLITTGCRVSGMANLTLGDLDLEAGEARVTEKGMKTRTLYLNQRCVNALRWWLNKRRTHKFAAESNAVWLGRKGPLTHYGIYQVLKRLARKAGVSGKYNPHAFRHAFARISLKHGADLGTVSRLLGHSDIVVTHNSYARWDDAELAERARRFAPLS